MGYEVLLNNRTVGYLGQDNKIEYNKESIRKVITEMVAGQPGSKKYFTTARVAYRWDSNRKINNDTIWKMWKVNPIMQNRISQLNGMVFGRGLTWIYDDSIKPIIDRFWRVNRLRSKLSALGTDAQLYGEVFIALYPQSTGDVLVTMFESSQVEIDFDPSNVFNVIAYHVSYKDENTGKDEIIDMMPIETYLNNLEFATPVDAATVTNKVRKSTGLQGTAGIKGGGIMCHIKFNNSTDEVYGTSDFKQALDILPDYMNFVGDRLTVHQIYGSPAYDIEIDTDDEEVIEKRIEELAGFTIGSNPVHNSKEKWTPLEFSNGGIAPSADEKIMRGLLCAAMGFPEYLLFNQSERQDDDNTFSVVKLAENRQDAFKEAFMDIHRLVVAVAGGDMAMVDDGQIVFPEINTMSEKAKAETYVLKVGANICSRRTAAINMGHNWVVEEAQIANEIEMFGDLLENNPDAAGAMGGRFTSRLNNSASGNEGADDGSKNRESRAKARNITTQVIGDHKQSH